MLFKTSVVLLLVWVVGLFGVYQIGELVHAFLLAGLMLLLLSFARSRDAALRPPPTDKR